MTSWPRCEARRARRRADVHAQLAAAGEDVDGAVLVRCEEDPEAGRWLCEPVDLLLERHDLLSGLFEGRDEPLVLTRNRGQIGLRLVEPLFENTNLSRGFRELPAQHGDLLLEEGDLRLEVTDLLFVLRLARPGIVTSGHARHLLRQRRRPTETLPIRRASVTWPAGTRVVAGESDLEGAPWGRLRSEGLGSDLGVPGPGVT